MKKTTPSFIKTSLFFLCLLALISHSRAEDAFKPQALMQQGPFKGEPLITDQQRTLREIFTIKKPGYRFFANFSHQRRFYVVGVPTHTQAVKSAVFHIETFPAPVPAAHTEIRFVLSTQFPAYIIPQTAFNSNGYLHYSLTGANKPQPLYNLVYSVEAVPVKGRPTYDIFLGTQDYFGAAFRLVSIEDRIHNMVIEQDHPVDQYKLKLNALQRSELLKRLLNQSQRDVEMKEVYHTLLKNCTNVIFEELDALTGNIRGPWQQMTTMIPTLSLNALKERNLVDPSVKEGQSRFPSLKEEYQSGRLNGWY